MKKIVISEKDNIGAVVEGGKVNEFFVHKGDVLLGDVYLSKVDNILPSIEAAFVDVGLDKMGFIHTDDIMGKGPLKEKVKPKQKLIVQVIKEPVGHKGPRMTTALSLPGRFLVLLPDEKGVNVSRKITSQKERARLKSIVSLLKPVGVGIIVRTEAEGQSEAEIQEDIEMLLEKWNSIVNAADTANPPTLLYRDQDLLYRTIREACDSDVDEIVVDTPFALHRTVQLLNHWNMQVKVTLHKDTEPLLAQTGVIKELQSALNKKVNLPCGGYLFIEPTEALTVIDVNSGKFVSSASQAETILKTNLEAADEIARQLKLRNIGGIVIVDFIDMVSRVDKLKVLEHFELALANDKAKPQIGQLSDLGLVELTRHRQGQSLAEVFTKKCDKCQGSGFTIEELKLANTNTQGELKAKMNKIKGPFSQQNNQNNNQNKNKFNKFQKNNQNKNNQKADENELLIEEIKAEIQEEVKVPEAVEIVEEVKVEENKKENKNHKNKKFNNKKQAKKEAKPIEEIKVEQVEPKEEAKTEVKEEKAEKPAKKPTRKMKKVEKTEDLTSDFADIAKDIVEASEEKKPAKKPTKKTSRTPKKSAKIKKEEK
ncbi:Rne/Rng family ribonuclease [bacterium]|nr:Rne/Rng family ribonuclease [bacterium]